MLHTLMRRLGVTAMMVSPLLTGVDTPESTTPQPAPAAAPIGAAQPQVSALAHYKLSALDRDVEIGYRRSTHGHIHVRELNRPDDPPG
jgi:hypothetical protein